VTPRFSQATISSRNYSNKIMIVNHLYGNHKPMKTTSYKHSIGENISGYTLLMQHFKEFKRNIIKKESVLIWEKHYSDFENSLLIQN